MKKDGTEEKERKEPAFPEGYEYLDDLIRDDLKRRREIDQQLEASSKDTSKPNIHTFRYMPPGFNDGKPSGNKDFYVQKLEAEKKQIDVNINERIEVQIQVFNTDPETAKQIRQTVMDKMHPNPYEGKGEKEMERLGRLEKDLDTSQDYMRHQLNIFREKHRKDEKQNDVQPEVTTENEPTTEVVPDKESSPDPVKSLDASQELMLKQKEQVKGLSVKEEKPVEEVKPTETKPITMSQRFSQSLSYSKALEKSPEKSSPEKGKEDKSPDKE